MTAWTEERCAALAELAVVVPTRVVVIGGVALAHHLGPEFRPTLDLDLCVAASPLHQLPPGSWQRLRDPPHRWRTPRGLTVDLLLVDAESLRRRAIAWPNGVRLDLTGIDFAMRDATAVGHGLPADVHVASLCALFLCKVTAWIERPGDRRKDLADLALILDRYVEHDDPRCCSDAAIPPDLDIAERPAFLLGLDLAVVPHSERDALTRFLDEVGDEDRAPHAMLAARWPRDDQALPRRLAALRAGIAGA